MKITRNSNFVKIFVQFDKTDILTIDIFICEKWWAFSMLLYSYKKHNWASIFQSCFNIELLLTALDENRIFMEPWKLK